METKSQPSAEFGVCYFPLLSVLLCDLVEGRGDVSIWEIVF